LDASIVNVYVPAVVGVPERTPVVAFSDSPGTLLDIDHVIGAVPVAANVKVYDTPTVPACSGDVLVIVGAVPADAV